MSLSKPAGFEHAQATIKCDHCGGVDDVKHYCLICEETICPTCKAIHNKARATRDHQVVLRGERHTKDQTTTFCKKHPDQRTSLHCDTCNVPVCMRCVAETHNGHKFSDIAKILENFKRDIKDSKKKTESRMKEVNALIQKTEQNWKDYENVIKRIESSISNDGVALHSLVDSMIQERKDELKHITHEDRASWERIKGRIDEDKIQLSTSLAQHDTFLSSTTTTGIAELLEESKVLRGKLLDYTEVVPQSYQTPSHSSIEGIGEIKRKTKCKPVVPRRTLNVVRAVVISSFESTVRGDASICYVGKDRILLGSEESNDIYSFNREGQILEKRENVLRNACYSLAVTPSGDILLTTALEKCIYMLNRQDEQTKLFDTSPYHTYFIHVTKNQEVLVCLERFEDGKSKGRVILYDVRGVNQRHIGSDEMYAWPFHAVELQDGEFCISDLGKNRLVVLNGDGNIRHIIENPLGRETFGPLGICTDKAGNILATDHFNDCVYVIGKNMSVRELVGKDEGIRNPRCICVDDDNYLWISQDNGEIKVVKYLEYHYLCNPKFC